MAQSSRSELRRTRCELIGDEILSDTLSQGSRLYVYPKPGLKARHAAVCVACGSLDTAVSRRESTHHGVPHFLEHRLFEKQEGDIAARFTALGAEVDAQTSFTSTTYSFECVDHFEEGLRLLLELVLKPHLTDTGLVREREIIEREIRLFEDDHAWVSFHTALKALYGHHPLAVDMAGTVESVAQIDRRSLEVFYRTFYRPERISIFLCGEVDPLAGRQLVQEILDGLLPRTDGEGGEMAIRQRPAPAPSTVSVSLPVSRPRLCMAFHDDEEGLTGLSLLKREICLEMAFDILFGPSSEFFASHYEAGRIQAESFGWETYAEIAFCFSMIGGDVDDPQGMMEAIYGELNRARDGNLIDRGYSRAHRKILGQLIYRFDEGEACTASMQSAVNREAEPFDYFRAHADVSIEDVESCLESCLNESNCGAAIVWPGDRRITR